MTNIFNKIQPGPNCAECEIAPSCPALKLQKKLATIANSGMSSQVTLFIVKKEMSSWTLSPTDVRKRLARAAQSLAGCAGAEDGKRKFEVGSVMGDNAKDGMNLVTLDSLTQTLASRAGLEETTVVLEKPTLPACPEPKENERAA